MTIFGQALGDPYASRVKWYCNYWQRSPSPFLEPDHVESAYKLFHGAMPTWEFDEIASIVPYLEKKYHAICSEIYADLENL
ncbi:hypothetical protein N7478_009961 [Penicillium angulare]|uniref:uncharacterized protein n=1 Tax=Penicillium angulare TaxID=116970 RepID=UPI00254110CD|nr:uncharacterized protein N7478_009961 [Penicillium angulare]KAJ5267153.1 hypothetical protein N7478_009961 [Penicillium angulare]